ncbi:MAG: hypothetical protein K9J13_10270 [Saprospiraceae bacterium]|nr:hypothetical protein [Saprospiraceae bacterium]
MKSRFKKILLILIVIILPFSAISQFKPPKQKKVKQPRGVLTPEQMDLKKTVTYQTDGQHWSDAEIIKLSKILKKIEFSTEWKQIKAKGDSYVLLSKGDARIYKKIVRKQNRAKYKMNKLMEKKRIPKDKNARKQYKKNVKKANEYNNPKKKRFKKKRKVRTSGSK